MPGCSILLVVVTLDQIEQELEAIQRFDTAFLRDPSPSIEDIADFKRRQAIKQELLDLAIALRAGIQ